MLNSIGVFIDSGTSEVADEFELFVSALEENREGFTLRCDDVRAAAYDRAVAGEDAVGRVGVEVGSEASGDDAAVDGRKIGLHAAAAEGVADLLAGIESAVLKHDKGRLRQAVRHILIVAKNTNGLANAKCKS